MSYTIFEKKELAPNTVIMQIHAPLAVKKMRPGQFIIVRVSANGERIPLSVSGWDIDKGTVRIIVQAAGRASSELIKLNAGDTIEDLSERGLAHTGSPAIRGRRGQRARGTRITIIPVARE